MIEKVFEAYSFIALFLFIILLVFILLGVIE